MNTAFHYLYRDASNYKAGRTVVLEGVPTPDDLDAVRAALSDGEWFIPSQVGLDDLQGELQALDSEASRNADGINEDDHLWHELTLPEDISETDEPPTPGMPSLADLVERFRRVTWDDTVPVPTLD